MQEVRRFKPSTVSRRTVAPRSRRRHPTIPLLDRISAALDADLIVAIAPHAA
jgi:hypothetical protein